MTVNEIESSVCLDDESSFWRGKIGPEICSDASTLSYELEELKSILDTASFIISDYKIRDMRSLDQHAKLEYKLNNIRSYLAIMRKLKKVLIHIDLHVRNCFEASESLYISIIESLNKEDLDKNAEVIKEIVEAHLYEQEIEQREKYNSAPVLNDELPF